jgi:hypothetical protein
MYLLTKKSFQALVEIIRKYRKCAGWLPGRHAVDLKLSMALRWLFGGTYLDIALAHCVFMSTFFHVVDETIYYVDDKSPLEIMHEDEEYLKRVSMGFTRGRSPLYGCAGAIDGIAIKIMEPWAGKQ